jgi:excisionase family DNA binding protein
MSELSVNVAFPSGLVDQLADGIAERLLARLGSAQDDTWLDTAGAASYLGCHRDTLRKLKARRAIPFEQERPGAKLYFRRSDLDAWRAAGGAVRHLGAATDGLPRRFRSS